MIDPDVREMLADFDRLGLPQPWQETPQQARATFARIAAMRAGSARPGSSGSSGSSGSVDRVRDEVIAGVPCRFVHPHTQSGLPPVVYLHGGGWVVGDLDTHQPIAVALCAELGTTVVAVDYRLAPEWPYPAALDDVYAVAEALAPVAVAGDSAGGNLAAAVCLRARDAAGPAIRAQLLLYPVLDATCSRPSYTENADGFGLTARSMRWYWGHYAAPVDDPLASPLAAGDVSGLPPAVIATAGFDVLRDEGDEYAARLAAAGVPVTHLSNPSLVHSFAAMTVRSPAARRAFVDSCLAFRDYLS